jgi:hypothetical protein
MEPEGSLPCSQEPATGPCSVPDESSAAGPSSLYPLGFSTIFYMHF